MKAHDLRLEPVTVPVGAGLPAKRPAHTTRIQLPDHLADLAVDELVELTGLDGPAQTAALRLPSFRRSTAWK